MTGQPKFYRDYRGDIYSPTMFAGPCLYFKTLPFNPGMLRACSRYSCPKQAECLDGKEAIKEYIEPFNVPVGGRGQYTAKPAIPIRLCIVPNCGEIHYAKDYCIKHYNHNLVYGDPLIKRKVTPAEVHLEPA